MSSGRYLAGRSGVLYSLVMQVWRLRLVHWPGAFAKASANASSGPAIRRMVVSFWFDDSKTLRACGGQGRWGHVHVVMFPCELSP